MRKVILTAVAVAALAAGTVQQAEARYDRNGWLAGGVVAGALLGGALLAAPRAQAAPVYSAPPAYYPGTPYYAEPEPYYNCRLVQRRVWDPYMGQWIIRQHEVCR